MAIVDSLPEVHYPYPSILQQYHQKRSTATRRRRWPRPSHAPSRGGGAQSIYQNHCPLLRHNSRPRNNGAPSLLVSSLITNPRRTSRYPLPSLNNSRRCRTPDSPASSRARDTPSRMYPGFTRNNDPRFPREIDGLRHEDLIIPGHIPLRHSCSSQVKESDRVRHVRIHADWWI